MIKARKTFFLGIILGLMLILSGCAKVTNPYKSEFTCPQAEKGECVAIMEAYKKSLKQSSNATELTNYFPSLDGKEETPQVYTEEQKIYAEELFNKLSRVLREPETPILTVPKVVRVLILPYKADQGKTLYFSRYAYVVVDDPVWVLENLLIPEDKDEEKQ